MKAVGLLLALLCILPACKERTDPEPVASQAAEPTATPDPAFAAEIATLHPIKDPVREAIWAFAKQVRPEYNARHFEALEKIAADLRANKETFESGSWKILQFYNALECREDEPESMWQLHDQIHKDWIAAHPQSITARVAQAEFLVSYAWHARGSGYANTVTAMGAKLMEERLGAAHLAIHQAKELPEKDPVLWMAALKVALGEGWPPARYNLVYDEAVAIEPKFWGFQTSRAYSLLPRWYGKPGDWEAFAAQAAARPDGLGPEVYARIVINLHGYYKNVFTETSADWTRTREGIRALLERCPNSPGVVNSAARLAVDAADRPFAQEMFARIGDAYISDDWKPETFVRYRTWAATGAWK